MRDASTWFFGREILNYPLTDTIPMLFLKIALQTLQMRPLHTEGLPTVIPSHCLLRSSSFVHVHSWKVFNDFLFLASEYLLLTSQPN